MRFLLQEYISLLKEDGELDTLITDLLISMNIIPLSKPQKGRQYGVDISAIGIDNDDGIKKVFLIAVKQGNLTRTNWDSKINSVRPTLNEIKDTYISIALSTKHQKLPKKIIVCTNGIMNQNVQIDWAQYINKYSEDNNIEFEFWGIGEILDKIEKFLITEKLFPPELQSLLRKTLAFLDLTDYNLSHFYLLIDKILDVNFKQEGKILKTLRLLRLSLNILFKWAQDIDNLKPSINSSERAILRCWDWMQKNELLDKQFAISEFYKLHILKLEIGIHFFNKLSDHYNVQHSLYRYSRNSLEYSLTVWEHIGILASIGLSEIGEAEMHYSLGSKASEKTKVHFSNAKKIAITLNNFILINPPSKYPEYDEHSIEITLALTLFCKVGLNNLAKDWIYALSLGISDAFRINKFFPLFRTNYDNLVDIYNGNKQCKTESSMLLAIMLEWSVVLDEIILYESIKDLINNNFPDVNLQLWLPTKETEAFLCQCNFSENTGSTKHSIQVYDKMEIFRQEIIEEIEKFNEEKKFKILNSGFYFISYISSRHFRSQPLPLLWRSFIKK